MRPKPQHLYNLFLFKHLVDQPVLDIDPTRISSFQIVNQGFERRGIGEGIEADDFEKLLGLGGERVPLSFFASFFA